MALTTAAMAAPAHAGLVISTAATQNASCSGNACEATAPNAVMNVRQLRSMLATGAQVSVTADRSQKDIVVNAPIGWAHKGVLELYAWRSVVVNNQIAVTGKGGVAIRTTRGELQFGPSASIAFWDVQSTLTINDINYTLVPDIQTLSSLVAANPAGHYALARDYDAAADGTYGASPLGLFAGTFEGLGHTIARFSVTDQQPTNGQVALFAAIKRGGRVVDLNLVNAKVEGVRGGTTIAVALLAVSNGGTIDHVFASGTAANANNLAAGLVDDNDGTISNSHVNVHVSGYNSNPVIGGLVASNSGIISKSFAEGSVLAGPAGYPPTGFVWAGGLVGANSGAIKDSYSLSTVIKNRSTGGGSDYLGGLVGVNNGAVVSSYSAGKFANRHSADNPTVGGLTGHQLTQPGGYSNVYWDRDLAVRDRHQGVGNMPDYPGVTGLTTAQLQAGLPSGFDPHVWAQTSAVNGGLPYLRSNPPPQ